LDIKAIKWVQNIGHFAPFWIFKEPI
jgi:hypothetical protein